MQGLNSDNFSDVSKARMQKSQLPKNQKWNKSFSKHKNGYQIKPDQTKLSWVPLFYSINRGVTSCLEYLEFTVTKTFLN